MAQPRAKQPLDVLQSMINAILIEVGRALRASDKEGGRTLASANTRLKTFFPGAMDNFHQALDDLECDIIRAKSVLLRDLEEHQAQRRALENPPIETVEGTAIDNTATNAFQEPIATKTQEKSPQLIVKEEETAPLNPKPEPTETKSDPSNDAKQNLTDNKKGLQGPSPPRSDQKSNLVGLGIDTTAAIDDAAPATSGLPESSIDSLFDIPDSANNDGSDMNFDSMEFLHSSNTQDQTEFDLSTFGNSQEFNMPDLDTANDGSGTTNESSNKQGDIFGLGNTSGEGDVMDLDLDLGTAGGDDSAFDDMFFGTGASGGGNMENGDFDNAFFGLD